MSYWEVSTGLAVGTKFAGFSVHVMSTQATKKQVLLMNDQPETLPLLVRALDAEGYQVIVALTLCDALAWLEVGTPRCLIVHRHTLTQPAPTVAWCREGQENGPPHRRSDTRYGSVGKESGGAEHPLRVVPAHRPSEHPR